MSSELLQALTVFGKYRYTTEPSVVLLFVGMKPSFPLNN